MLSLTLWLSICDHLPVVLGTYFCSSEKCRHSDVRVFGCNGGEEFPATFTAEVSRFGAQHTDSKHVLNHHLKTETEQISPQEGKLRKNICKSL